MLRILVLAFSLACAAGSASAQVWLDPAWRARVPVVLTEPDLAPRTQEYVDVVVDFSAYPFTDLPDEVRVADALGVELPSLVHSISGSSAHVLFALPAIAQAGSETVYVYWGNPSAGPPAYSFPDVEITFYRQLGFDFASDLNAIAGLEALVAYGRIEVALTQIEGTTGYDQAAALSARIGTIGALCSVHTQLATSSIYQDVPIWGVTDGNCLTAGIFGLTDAAGGEVAVPDPTTYVSQDFFPGSPAGFDCDIRVVPDTGSIPELVVPAGSDDACHLRFEPGHVLSNGRELRYRSFLTGEGDPWNPQLQAIATRSLELILQDNRVGIATGTSETQTAGCPDVPRAGCMAAGKSSLQLKDAANDAQDKLSFKFQRAAGELLPADVGDPVSSASELRACLYDTGAGGVHRVAASLSVEGAGSCAGKACWSAKGATLRYADPAADSSGVQKLTVKTGAPGKGSIQLAARGIALPMPAPFSGAALFEQDSEVLVQVSSSGAEACFEGRFDAASTKQNTATGFKAIAK